MTRIANLILVFLLFAFLSSCITKIGVIKHPCFGEDFLSDIGTRSQEELGKLARILEANSYAQTDKSGCRAALLAQVYAAQKRSSRASEYFVLAAKKLPDLSDYFLLAKAQIEFKRRDFDLAQQSAYALLNSHTSLSSPAFARRVRTILADVAAQVKDDHQIIRTHQELLNSGFKENQVLLFNLASSLTKVGEHQKADEIYRQLLINFPASPEAKRIEQMRSLAQYQLSLKETETRFNKLIEQLAFRDATRDADDLLKADNIDRETKGHIEGLAVKSLMLNNQFAQGVKRARIGASKKDATTKEMESYAWSLAKIGRHIDASNAYGHVLDMASDSEAKGRGCFFKGFSLYEANLYSMALLAWQSCSEEIKGTSQFENYLWYQALASILSENHQQALDHFRSLKRYFPTSKDDEKYTYFLAHTLRHLHKDIDAQAILRELARRPKPSYYVLLARKAVNAPNESGTLIEPDALSKLAKIGEESSSKNALILFHLGFKEEARDLVLRAEASPDDKFAMLQHMGFYHDVWQRSHLLQSDVKIVDNALVAKKGVRSTYPMPYRSIIDGICRKYDVNRNLLYAIMQAESGFLETAVSFRGAVGLMQMMPFVAHDLASRVALNEFDREHLKDPKIAIELGALFLAILQRQFGNPHLVVAAYNAGPHQVQKWLDVFGHLPPDLFVERIPFKQTRDYVKTVLPSESLYRAMTGKTLRLAL